MVVVPELDVFNSEITIWVSGETSKTLPSKNVISAVDFPEDLMASPERSSIPAVPEIQSLAPDRNTKMSPTDTEKIVAGTDGVVTVGVVVGDWVVDTVGVLVVVVVSPGMVDVGVVAVDVVEFVQANTLVIINKDRIKRLRILTDTDLFIFI